jgi:DNA-binding CsgD family transcriptional regulator
LTHRVIAVRPGPHPPSKRQQQVLNLWIGGRSYNEIARRLGIAVWTVKDILEQVGAKWDTYSFDEMFEIALREGFADSSHLEYAK